MFIEFVDPIVIDEVSTRDRVKIRYGERGSQARFWSVLTFYDRKSAKEFGEAIVKLASEEAASNH